MHMYMYNHQNIEYNHFDLHVPITIAQDTAELTFERLGVIPRLRLPSALASQRVEIGTIGSVFLISVYFKQTTSTHDAEQCKQSVFSLFSPTMINLSIHIETMVVARLDILTLALACDPNPL